MFTYKLDEDAYLKPLELHEAQDFFDLIEQSKSHLRPWMPWTDWTNQVKDTEGFIRSTMEQVGRNDGFQAGIWYKGKAAGVIGFHRVDWTNKATSIGYWLGEAFIGKGLMTKASAPLLEHAFTAYDLERIELRASTQNKKSQLVAERLGFTKEGIARRAEWVDGQFHDHIVYSLLKEEWKKSYSF
ncbi:ribosomal-protein-serine acetyltransferase [Alkalihalobacillus xiaoxiensis]|uniref:Ribosomal-protein-serine acetyltransferase n=1 Tax=Shouchella xiaoxiensis TaxID=766895 RepID=A0ABS2STW4_9BACI|nr:GNAT family protein [Shouchella xiaoxiensis]MBM7838969.1 ribosomal-protein-serine acetyltransferase [Shouchella xiaoxiensis]